MHPVPATVAVAAMVKYVQFSLVVWPQESETEKCQIIQYTIDSLLICTLITENQGLEKSRSASNLRKISGPANLDFFFGLYLEKS